MISDGHTDKRTDRDIHIDRQTHRPIASLVMAFWLAGMRRGTQGRLNDRHKHNEANREMHTLIHGPGSRVNGATKDENSFRQSPYQRQKANISSEATMLINTVLVPQRAAHTP